MPAYSPAKVDLGCSLDTSRNLTVLSAKSHQDLSYTNFLGVGLCPNGRYIITLVGAIVLVRC
jgi:hypothetical protein